MRGIAVILLLLPLAMTSAGAQSASSPASPPASTPPLVQAMRDEMARAISGLRMPGQPAPYFIAYTVDDTTRTTLTAAWGSLTHSLSLRTRQVRVEVRVGDYARDNSRFMNIEFDPGVASMYGMGVIQGSLDDDMDVVRRQLWLVTDAAYRRALGTYAKKQAALQNQMASEPVPDFSRETPLQRLEPAPAGAAKSAAQPELTAMVTEVSAALAAPEITGSDVSFYMTRGTRYFVNSEGSVTVTPQQSSGVRLSAETLADDGMPLRDASLELARSPDRLPSTAALVARARELKTALLTLRTAPIGEDYSGPVLVEREAAAELVVQTLAPLFLSLRAPESENPQMAAAMSRAPSTPYLTRVGAKVLPDTLSVMDTPSLQRYQDQDVPGAYAVDDEAVAAQDVTLCDKGVLKTLLTSRTPQRGFLQSNGHSRSGFAQVGVFQVQSAAGVPSSELRTRYLAKLKQEGRPFGYILRAIGAAGAGTPSDAEGMRAMMMMGGQGGPTAPTGPSIVRAFKVTPDGQETLVRGLQLGVVTHTAWRDILEVSDDRMLYSQRATLPPQMRRFAMLAPGVSAGDAIISIIAPNLLFGELEIQKTTAVFQRPPIVASPLK